MAKTNPGGSGKSPLLRIAKREDIPRWKAWLIRLIAVVLALAVDGLIIFAIVKLNPVEVYQAMFSGAFGTARRSWVSIRDITILLSIGIGLAPAFKMKFWNLGAEGQILVGGVATAGCMIYFGGHIPNWLLLIVMALASIIAGGIWGLIPAAAKARWDTNESLFTLMMNYVAIQLTSYAVARWENPGGLQHRGHHQPEDPGRLVPRAVRPGLRPERAPGACILTVGMFLYLKYTKQGYEIAVVGES